MHALLVIDAAHREAAACREEAVVGRGAQAEALLVLAAAELVEDLGRG